MKKEIDIAKEAQGFVQLAVTRKSFCRIRMGFFAFRVYMLSIFSMHNDWETFKVLVEYFFHVYRKTLERTAKRP